MLQSRKRKLMNCSRLRGTKDMGQLNAMSDPGLDLRVENWLPKKLLEQVIKFECELLVIICIND